MFLYATCFSPVNLTLIKAIKNLNLETWLGLTANLISKNIPKLEANNFGNLDQSPKNTRSTKSEHLALDMETIFFPSREETTNLVFVAISLSNPETVTLFTYITGRLPFNRNRGMQYMLILYAYDANTILVNIMDNEA